MSLRIHWPRSSMIMLAAVLLQACMNYPRNGQQIDVPAGKIEMSGSVSYPGDTLYFEQQDQTNGTWFKTGYGATSATTPSYTDSKGVSWYFYNKDQVLLGQSKALWRKKSKVGTQRRVSTDVRTVSKKGNGPLYSFDVNADTCLNDASAQGGAAMASTCKSASSPEAELILDCGKASQFCCTGYDLTAAEACDTGRLCDGSKCTIAAGGKNQPCNANGSCSSGLSCVANVCRDTTVEKAPIYSLEIEVRTCNDSSWVTSGGKYIAVSFGGGPKQVLDNPGTDFSVGTTSRFSLISIAPKTIGDIKDMTIDLHSAYWCFDSLKIYANSQVLYSATYPTPVLMRATYPENRDSWTLPRATMRADYLARNIAPVCDAPTTYPGAAIERAAQAAFANVLGNSSELRWGDGFVMTTPLGADKILLYAMITAEPNAIPATLEITLSTTITFSCACTGSPCNGAVHMDVAPLEVLDVDGGAGYNIANWLSAGFLEAFAEDMAQEMVNAEAGMLNIGPAIQGLLVCPTLAVQAVVPPGLAITYPLTPAAGVMCL